MFRIPYLTDVYLCFVCREHTLYACSLYSFIVLFLYSGVGAEAKNQLLVMRALANTFSKGCGAQFMCDEQKWV